MIRGEASGKFFPTCSPIQPSSRKQPPHHFGGRRNDAGEAFGKFTEPAIMAKVASPIVLAAEGMMRAKSRKLVES